jgi:hypothetical protein
MCLVLPRMRLTWSRSSGGNHGYQAVQSVVSMDNSFSSAAALCENQPNLTAIFSVGILSGVLKRPQGRCRCVYLCFDVDGLRKLLCLHGSRCPMFGPSGKPRVAYALNLNFPKIPLNQRSLKQAQGTLNLNS